VDENKNGDGNGNENGNENEDGNGVDAMKLIFCKAAADIKAGQELVVDEAGNARPVTGYDLRFHPMFTEAQRKGKQDVKGQTDTDEDTDF